VFVNQVQTSSFGRRERALTIHVKACKLQGCVPLGLFLCLRLDYDTLFGVDQEIEVQEKHDCNPRRNRHEHGRSSSEIPARWHFPELSDACCRLEVAHRQVVLRVEIHELFSWANSTASRVCVVSPSVLESSSYSRLARW